MSEYALFTPAEAKAEREKRNKSREVTPPAQERTDKEVRLPDTKRRGREKVSVRATPSESEQDEAGNANGKHQPDARKPIGRKTLKRKNEAFKPSREDESEDEEPKSPKKKPKLKAKAAKTDTETAPTRRSARRQDIYQPSKEDEDDEEEAYDEPSSSARGGQRKRKAAAVTSVSKKAKRKK